MVYLVSYDLGQPNRNYEALTKKIQSYGTRAKVLESLWLIKTTDTASAVMEHLKGAIDKDDKLVVIEIKRHWSTLHLPQEVIDWMNNNIV